MRLFLLCRHSDSSEESMPIRQKIWIHRYAQNDDVTNLESLR